MQLKQDESTINEDFIKTVIKELKVYKKHHRYAFLWGKDQYQCLDELVTAEATEDIAANKTFPTIKYINDFLKLTKEELCK